jgi:hypothetical protein
LRWLRGRPCTNIFIGPLSGGRSSAFAYDPARGMLMRRGGCRDGQKREDP